MSRRISVLVAVTALAVSSFVPAAYAADRTNDQECTQQEKAQQEAAAATTQGEAAAQAVTVAPEPATLEASFAVSADAASVETEDGVSAMVGPIEVVVARIGPDGKPVMACVDDIKAARRFFNVPAETPAPKAKEQ